jgi:hypothetical protein
LKIFPRTGFVPNVVLKKNFSRNWIDRFLPIMNKRNYEVPLFLLLLAIAKLAETTWVSFRPHHVPRAWAYPVCLYLCFPANGRITDVRAHFSASPKTGDNNS